MGFDVCGMMCRFEYGFIKEMMMWICKNCNEKCEDQFDACWNCGCDNPEPSNRHNGAEQEKEQKIESGELSLSEKYGILKNYKVICYIMIFLSTGLTIYSVLKQLDAQEAYNQLGADIGILNYTILSTLVIYVVGAFSLYCLTSIINFLFELDDLNVDKN